VRASVVVSPRSAVACWGSVTSRFEYLTSVCHRCLVPTATSHALCTAHRLGFNHFTRCGPTARAHAIRGPRAVIRAKTD
jgi:hypothetical protein